MRAGHVSKALLRLLFKEHPEYFVSDVTPDVLAKVPKLRYPIVVPAEYKIHIPAAASSWARRRVALWLAQGGKCFWCARATLLPGHDGYFRTKQGALSGYAATVDHIYSKLHPLRYQFQASHDMPYVMACSTCNNKRSKAECQQLHRLISRLDKERREHTGGMVVGR